jgi:hypothetical protein
MAQGRSHGRRDSQSYGRRDAARRGDYALNTKDNFIFERALRYR